MREKWDRGNRGRKGMDERRDGTEGTGKKRKG